MCTAMLMGSTPLLGEAPWAPWPVTRTAKLEQAAMAAPSRKATVPVSVRVVTWQEKAASTGGSDSAPRRIISPAPRSTSSPGWNSSFTVPGREDSFSLSIRAAVSSAAVCRSWPQVWAASV